MTREVYIEEGYFCIDSNEGQIRIPMEKKLEFINKDGDKEIKIVKTKLDLSKLGLHGEVISD